MSIYENIINLKKQIETKKEDLSLKRDITLIAVSKTYSSDKIEEAIKSGQLHFGENKVNEAIEKIEKINNPNVTWHLIGHLQTNKASKAVRYFDVIHSIDSVKLAEKVNSFAIQYKKNIEVFIQVNTTDEETKSGIKEDQAENIAKYIINECNYLKLIGLMTIGPLIGSEKDIRKSFKDLKKLKDDLSKKFGEKYFSCLSMGMSGDWKIAIEEGTTHLRIGSLIFGSRN